MNTPAHVVINLVLLDRDPKKKLTTPILVGSILPDAPMLVFYYYYKVIRQTAEIEIWTNYYLVSFDSMLCEGIGHSNLSLIKENCTSVYGLAFFPWLHPVKLEVDDKVTIRLQAALIQGQYVWRWDSKVLCKGELVADFHQSDFLGQRQNPKDLAKMALDYHPSFNEEGALHQQILRLMTGDKSIRTIADQVFGEFPNLFSTKEAAAKVAKISKRFSI